MAVTIESRPVPPPPPADVLAREATWAQSWNTVPSESSIGDI